MTVVFDAGQNSEGNFAFLAGTGLHYVGSVPASDCPDLTALPASMRTVVDEHRFAGLTACDTRRVVYGTERRAILTHSPSCASPRPAGSTARPWPSRQARRAGRHPGPRQDPPHPRQGRSRDHRDHPRTLGAEGHPLGTVRRAARDLRLTWHIDEDARAALEEEIFGNTS